MTGGLSEPLSVVLEVVRALEELEVPYHVGGSFASSAHGIPRQTHDADLVVDLPPGRIAALVERLKDHFMIDEPTVRDAIARKSCFNVIHFGTAFKVDIFQRQDGEFDRLELERHRRERLQDDPVVELVVKSPEDTILRKLEWYRKGGETSERQISDVLGIVRVQGDRLDRDYLRTWGSRLGVGDLVERTLLGG